MSREYPSRPLVGVGAVIVYKGRVALVRRAHPPAKGRWSIPGGLVRVGETLKEAVVREASEETNLDVEPLDLIEVVERIFPDKDGRIQYHYVLADYVCSVRSGVLTPASDVSEAAWVTLDEMPGLKVPRVTVEVIRKALQKLKRWSS
ncbi:MAG: NUDIX domain-containing protein [Deltaproteobacteria bacterium]|nr:NUDIX domain-containing protein [Deltaproteobacteria bacterium]